MDPIVVDLGNFMETDARKAPVVNPFLIEMMRRDGMDVVVPGPVEFSRAPEFLDLMEGSGIAILSSNTTLMTPEGAVDWDPWLLLEKSGVRVGLMGLLGEDEYEQIHLPDGYRIDFKDPVATALELVPQIRASGAELVVALVAMGDNEALAFARRVRGKGIQVVVGGIMSMSSAFPIWNGDMRGAMKNLGRPLGPNDILVNRSGIRGQDMSVTRLILDLEGNIVEWGGKTYMLNKHYTEDPDVEERVEQIKAILKGGRPG